MRNKKNQFKVSILFLCFCAFLLNGIALQAAVVNVTTTADNVPGSLRAAITLANTSTTPTTIILPAGHYVLSGASREDVNLSGDLDIYNKVSPVVIQGADQNTTIIDGNHIDRVFHIISGTVTISNVTIKNGQSDGILTSTYDKINGENGGGIYNLSNLVIKNCTITANKGGTGLDDRTVGDGGNGGGIYNQGKLEMTNCIVSFNEGGLGGIDTSSIDPYFGKNGDGGGIYNTKNMQIINCSIHDNKNSGITNNKGYMQLTRCNLYNNYALSHGGGAIYNLGNASLTACSIHNNSTSDAGDGTDMYCSNSKSGESGGGIWNSGIIEIFSSDIYSNVTGNAGNQSCVELYAGSGGGLYNIGTASLTNCTISSNTTGDSKSKGGTAPGGGIYSTKGLTLINCTVAFNHTGNTGTYESSNNYNAVRGGGIYLTEPGASIQNTIIAGNSIDSRGEGPDCYGSFNSLGYNLIENASGCTITGMQTGNIIGKNPLLGTLANNGGFTMTHSLSPDSPAIDAGNSPTTQSDQRGNSRPTDVATIPNVADGSDIGAYEYSPNSTQPWLNLERTQLSFGGTPYTSIPSQTVLISNLNKGTFNWNVSSNSQWLSVSPSSGSGDALLTVSVNPTGLASGDYTGTITVIASGAFDDTQTITVSLHIYSTGATTVPFGEFATPLEGSTLANSIPVTGWALDDIGVSSVKIYNGETYIGDANFVEGARPDVEEAYPTFPNNYKAGWGYMLLTHFLPGGGNGTYTLIAKATDVEGNEIILGSKTITIDNAHAVKPFGAIDTPTQGGIATGKQYINYGWALTPKPNAIATDGSTINVLIDGAVMGHPVYNNYRADIASLFPGYANSNAAVGYFYIDTTYLKNGVHTISWDVTDNAGNCDGIGSRYFSVRNMTSASLANTSATPEITDIYSLENIPTNPHPIALLSQKNKTRQPKPILMNENDSYEIQSKELKTIQISLKEASEPASHFYGYMLVGEQLRELPIGTTLDSQNGIFYWSPGPGFVGQYHFVFVSQDEQGEFSKRNITITINPM